MDLLSQIQEAYGSSSEDDDQKQDNNQVTANKPELIKSSVLTSNLIMPESIDLAPDVNIIDLQLQKFTQEINHFKNTNEVITKKNHLNGVIEKININEGKFHEQFHNFENFGYAANPSDNAGVSGGSK